MSEFDRIESGNTHPIHLVMREIKTSAPQGVKVEWQFPGYISIVLNDGTEIAFGESLESKSGYSWNSFDSEGTSDYCDSFDDLKDINSIVERLWDQAKPLLEKGAN